MLPVKLSPAAQSELVWADKRYVISPEDRATILECAEALERNSRLRATGQPCHWVTPEAMRLAIGVIVGHKPKPESR